MLCHDSIATATEYPMLALRQDNAFVMIMEDEERYSDTQSAIKWYEFRFSSIQRKSTAVFTLQVETEAAA